MSNIKFFIKINITTLQSRNLIVSFDISRLVTPNYLIEETMSYIFIENIFLREILGVVLDQSFDPVHPFMKPITKPAARLPVIGIP